MSHGGHGASGGAAEHVETLGSSLHLVAMVHPDLRVRRSDRRRAGAACAVRESRKSVLAFVAFADAAAQHVRHELLAIADAEHGATGGENGRIDLRTARFVDAVGTAGDDDALAGQCSSAAGVSLGCTSAYTPRSRIFLAIR